ncbi:MAG: response regulator transcription factor [Acidimicrobiales bacterium]
MAASSGAIARSVGLQRSARLLVIDEDEERALKVTAGLEQQGFAVRYAGDGPAGFALMAQQMPDLLLVYAILPGMSGIDVCRHLRRAGSEVPIIVLSPRSDEIDVVVTMEMGADDFIAEPYGMPELVARVRAVLRRSNRPAIKQSVPPPCERYSSGGRQPVPSTETGAQYGLSPQAQSARIMGPRFGSSRSGMPDQGGDAGPDILKVGDLSLDRARHEVLLRDKPIDLPLREFLLLEAFLEKPGRLLTRQVLIERIWGPGWGSRRILSTLVSRLRALIESNADDPSRIVTIRGIGYRYDVPSEGGPVRPDDI